MSKNCNQKPPTDNQNDLFMYFFHHEPQWMVVKDTIFLEIIGGTFTPIRPKKIIFFNIK